MSNSQEDLVIRLRAISEGFDAAQSQLKGLQAELQGTTTTTTGLGTKTKETTTALFDNATAHVNLAEKAGLNRRELSMVVGELGNIAGISPGAVQGVEALAHGFGVVAVGAVAAVEIIKAAQQASDEHAKALNEQRLALSQSNITMQAYEVQSVELTKATMTLKEATSGQLTPAIQANIIAQMAASEANRVLADSEYRIGQLHREIAEANINSLARTLALNEGTDKYAESVLKLAEAYAPLNFQGQEFNKLAPEQQDAMIKLAEAVGGSYVQAMDNAAVANQNMMRSTQDNAAMQIFLAGAIKEAVTAEGELTGFGPAGNIRANAQDPWKAKLEDIREFVAEQNKILIGGASGAGAAGAATGSAYASGVQTAIAAAKAPSFTVGGRSLEAELALPFSSQSGAIQQAFVDAAGGNKDQAIQNWMNEHKAELMAEFAANSAQFAGYGTAAGALAAGPVGPTSPAALAGAGATGGPGSSILAGMQQQLSSANFAPDFLKSIQSHESDWRKNGEKMATIVLDGFASEIDASVGDLATRFGRSLQNWGDNRYIRQPKLFGVTQ